MVIDALIAEIGSTTTLVTGFDQLGTKHPIIVGQGEHYTTVQEGDVMIGLHRAIESMEQKQGQKIRWNRLYASSSAAGGLRMSVHGLVFDMTVRAAKEAALGAGAIIKHITSGKLSDDEIILLQEIRPNVVLIAGGVDFGEKETVIHNSRILAQSPLDVPFIFAGNVSAKPIVRQIFEQAGKQVILTDNVYPQVDELHVEPVRKIIQEVFSQHIIHAKGMDQLAKQVDSRIFPTPAAVMETTELLAEIYGDVMVIDIGGATTDVDSVTQGTPEIQQISIHPEPLAKRTVEGDLGVFINARNVSVAMGQEGSVLQENVSESQWLDRMSPYPEDESMEAITARLATFCARVAVRRHAGKFRYYYGPNGRQKMAYGKDLTAIKGIAGTGGVLCRSRHSNQILQSLKSLSAMFPQELLPPPDVCLWRDSQYIFAPIGVLSSIEPENARQLLQTDLECCAQEAIP